MRFSPDQTNWDPKLKNPFDGRHEGRNDLKQKELPAVWNIFELNWSRIFLRCILPASAVSLVLAGIGFWIYVSAPAPTIPLIYLEVKAINETGHPIAGGTVSINDKKVGVTDAFGEWRRYIRLAAREKVSLRIVKDHSTGRLIGGTSVVVPEPGSQAHDEGLKLRVRMVSQGKLKKAKAYIHKVESSNADPSQSLEERIPYDKIYVGFRSMHVFDSQKSKKYYERVKDSLVPELKSQLQAKSMKVGPSNDLKLVLSYVPIMGRSGLIKAEIAWRELKGWRHESFMRNFSETAEATALDIMGVVRAYIPKSYESYLDGQRWYLKPEASKSFWSLSDDMILWDGINEYPLKFDHHSQRFELLNGLDHPCQATRDRCTLRQSTLGQRPPGTGWQKLRFKITSAIPKKSQFYVAGFRAKPLGHGLWQYWGKPGSSYYLTLVDGRTIRLRQKLKAHRDGIEVVVTSFGYTQSAAVEKKTRDQDDT